MAWHQDHDEGDLGREYVTYGDLSDEDRPYAKEATEDGSWEEDSDTELVMKCCGQDRPMRKKGKKLVIMPSVGGQFVTVHDYISAVHPRLMSLREDMKLRPLPGLSPIPCCLRSDGWWTKDQNTRQKRGKTWIRFHGPPRPMSATAAAIFNMRRAERKNQIDPGPKLFVQVELLVVVGDEVMGMPVGVGPLVALCMDEDEALEEVDLEEEPEVEELHFPYCG